MWSTLITLLLSVLAMGFARRMYRARRFPAPDWKTMKRTFVVTGAASGIGRATCADILKRASGNKNVHVFACDVNAEGLRASAKELGWNVDEIGGQCTLAVVDITSVQDWEKLYEQIGAKAPGVPIAHFNIAGFLHPGNVLDDPFDRQLLMMNRTIDINFKGLVNGTLVAAKHAREQFPGYSSLKSGGVPKLHVVNVTSYASLFPYVGAAFYGASKMAARGFTLALSKEVSKEGIAITAVAPDAVRTPMLDKQHAVDATALAFLDFIEVDVLVNAMLDNAFRNRPRELWVPFPRALLGAVLLGLLFDTGLVDLVSNISIHISKSKRGSYKPAIATPVAEKKKD